MKRLNLLLIAVLVAAITGCKKEKPIPVSDSLTGTWELRQDGGGWTPIVQHKAGNDTLAVFTANTYSFYNKGKLFKSGTYAVRKYTSFMYNQLKNRIIFDGNTNDMRQFFDIQNNQLGFWIDAYDAPMVMYQRLK